jgi:alanine dehydrogenase
MISDTLLLKRNEIVRLLTIEECIDAVEHAFKMRALGIAAAPGILGVHAADGGFHIKAGILNLGREYFVAKTNANFPENRKRHGLPTIQGVIMVSDATNGKTLALMDSTEVTIIRTGAATAVAAKYLSRENSTTATIFGCGNQGKISLKALLKVRALKTIYVHDIDESLAHHFAKTLSEELQISIDVPKDIRKALAQTDICVTCTPANSYFINKRDIALGTFIAAVGSDSEHKQELDPLLLSTQKVVVDSLEQCAKIGELHHALALGIMKKERVYAELGEVIAMQKAGRENKDEVIIYDSTGTALQDVAAAAIVYERAIRMRIGSRINLAE